MKTSNSVVGVALDEIDPDLRPASQMRAQLDTEAIADYAEHLDRMPAVRLMYDRKAETHWLIDGCHTVHAARQRGEARIRAEVEEGDYLEAFGRACESNRAHGVRITNHDKRHRVEEALNIPDMKTWPNTKVAAWCMVSKDLVRLVRQDRQSAVVAHSNEPERRVRSNNKPYPAVLGPRESRDEPEPNGRPESAPSRWSPAIVKTPLHPVVVEDNCFAVMDDDELPEPTPPPAPEDQDMEHVKQCGLYHALQGEQRKRFVADALRYFKTRELREAYTNRFARLAGKSTPERTFEPWTWRTMCYLQTPHPSRWLQCMGPDSGKCIGTGCKVCHGFGYNIPIR